MKRVTRLLPGDLFSIASFLMSALLLITTMTSCTRKTIEDIQIATPEEVAPAKAAKPSPLPEVLLKVTVRDAAGDRITSDLGGDYISGSQSVYAAFDQVGNFIFRMGPASNNPNSPLVRWLNFDFSDPIAVYIPPPITTGNNKGNGVSTGSVSAFTFIPLQNLPISQTACIGFTCGPNYKNSPPWTLNYHRATEDVSTSPTAYMVVTRISSTQWTMTPLGSCSSNTNVAALRNGPGTLYGYYNMPFALTLTKL